MDQIALEQMDQMMEINVSLIFLSGYHLAQKWLISLKTSTEKSAVHYSQ
jgi:hypothetical protein